MDFIFKEIPAFIYKKKNIISMLIFTAVFALVFINAYKPFAVQQWYSGVGDTHILVGSSLLILLGVVVVAVSRMVMYRFSARHKILYWQFIVWVLCEIVVMASSYMGLSYAVEPHQSFWPVMLCSLRNTALIIAIPYIISLLYFSYREKSEKVRKLEQEKDEPKQQTGDQAIYAFCDARGEMKLSVKRQNLLYLESEDNYVNIWYLNKGKVEHYLLRNTMKRLEEYFNGTKVMRCHRSYMVNFDNVSLIRRDRDGAIYVVLTADGVADIPVTPTYADSVTGAFLK